MDLESSYCLHFYMEDDCHVFAHAHREPFARLELMDDRQKMPMEERRHLSYLILIVALSFEATSSPNLEWDS
ncbi:hypothetical protein Peur_011553 [Populus x canadensis]